MPIPHIIPTYPNIIVIMTASINTNEIMFALLAPMTLRTPSSRVRSFTVIIMILLTPTIPAIKVAKPIIQTKTPMAEIIFWVLSTCSYELTIFTPLLSVGAHPKREDNKCCTSDTSCSFCSAVCMFSTIRLTELITPS